MPVAALYPCVEPRCPKMAATRGRCRDHAQEIDTRRGTATERGYDHRWAKAAAAFKARNPLCGMRDDNKAPVMSRCHALGYSTAAYQVDHVEPHRGDKVKFWDTSNWQSLCRSCGAAKSRAGL